MHVEPEFEAFLSKIIPGCEQHWRGATEEEIEEIEDLAELPLPPFYKWFLGRMGRTMGPLDDPHQDLSCTTVISSYEAGSVSASPNLLLIATEPDDDFMPMHVYYDLSKPTRNDALVCSAPADGGYLQIEFETLREAIAWGTLLRLRVGRSAHRCEGTFSDHARDILTKLTPALEELGFMQPIDAGLFCAIFERADATLIGMAPPRGDKPPHLSFHISANDEATIRSILGHIATKTSLEVEIREWR